MTIERIGIVGAGTMGAGISLDLAGSGFSGILVVDISEKALEKCRVSIASDLRMLKMMNKVPRELTKEMLLERLRFQTSYDGFEKVDLVIESVPEYWEIKKDVYLGLREVCRPEAIYASNTSCMSITKIASLLPRPENVIGVHFMNPVPLKKMVETARGYHTSDGTIEKIKEFLKRLKKRTIVVKDFPGFVTNRLSHLLMNEAAFLVHEGVAEPRDIDLMFKHGYEHAMGPLETADLIGIDTVVASLDVLFQNYQDPKFRCCPLLRRMAEAGLLGRKSGRGFFEYDREQR